MSPRSAPYLWVQLINAGALPLEALLLLLLLAGADPGPVPGLERLLAWGLGAAAPALLLWKRPADPRSLLLLRCTGTVDGPWAWQSGSPNQKRWLPLLFAAGVLLLLPVLSWLDGTAALASQLSPLRGSERLTCLMASAALLALMVWQWQQLIQAIWLLSQNQSPGPDPAPATAGDGASRNLGLPLLRLAPLDWSEPDNTGARPARDAGPQGPESAALVEEPPEPTEGTELAEIPAVELVEPEGFEPVAAEPESVEPELLDQQTVEPEVLEPEVIDPDGSAVPLAVEPEQTSEDSQGGDLDQQIG